MEGAESGYIISIGGLAQFDRGLMSGWMGTLNDWFVNEGFQQLFRRKRNLGGRDTVAVMHTLTTARIPAVLGRTAIRRSSLR